MAQVMTAGYDYGCAAQSPLTCCEFDRLAAAAGFSNEDEGRLRDI